MNIIKKIRKVINLSEVTTQSNQIQTEVKNYIQNKLRELLVRLYV